MARNYVCEMYVDRAWPNKHATWSPLAAWLVNWHMMWCTHDRLQQLTYLLLERKTGRKSPTWCKRSGWENSFNLVCYFSVSSFIFSGWFPSILTFLTLPFSLAVLAGSRFLLSCTLLLVCEIRFATLPLYRFATLPLICSICIFFTLSLSWTPWSRWWGVAWGGA